MYTKLFPEMYTGSMVGAGCVVFAVWPYALANCDEHGCVELNPRLLAMVLGASVPDIDQAISYLGQPDPDSRSDAEDGRRIVQEGKFLYRVVNFAKYRAIRDRQDRRASQREWDRRNRPSGHQRASSPTQSDTVRHSPTGPTHTDTETKNPPTPQGGDAAFDRFWQTYPKKVAKHAALRAWKRLSPGTALAEIIIADVGRRRSSPGWTKDSGQYIPNPATYLNSKRWEDELPQVAPAQPTAPEIEPLEIGPDGLTGRERALQAIGRRK